MSFWVVNAQRKELFLHLYVQFQIHQDSDLCWLLGIAAIQREIMFIHIKHTRKK